MRKIREILRLKWVAQRSHRETARSLGVSPGAVASAVGRATRHGADLGRGRGAERRRLGARAVRPAAGRDRRRPAGAGPGLDPPGAAPARRHAGAAARRVSRRAPDGLSLLGVLRAVSRLARAAAPVDAAGPQGRREGLRRLRRPAAHDRRRRHGRGDRRRALRRRARRLELHLRRGDADATERGLDREPRPRRRVLRRRAGGLGAGSTAHRRDGAVPLRAGRPADLRGVGAALSHGHHSGASGETSRQSQGRSGRAGRRALDPGAPPPRDLLHARGAEYPDRRAAARRSTRAR